MSKRIWLSTLVFALLAAVISRPALSSESFTLRQAVLPQADLLVGGDSTGLTKDHFLYKLMLDNQKNILGEDSNGILECFDSDVDGSCKWLSSVRLKENANFDELRPEDVDFAMVFLNSVPMGDKIEKEIAGIRKLLAMATTGEAGAKDEFKAASNPLQGLKAWDFSLACDELSGKATMVLSKDEKSAMFSRREMLPGLMKAVGGDPAVERVMAAAPSGAGFYLAFLLKEKSRQSIQPLFESAAPGVDVNKIDSFMLSMTVNPANVVLSLRIGAGDDATAAAIEQLIAAFVPMAQGLTSGDERLACIKSLACKANGSAVVISVTITEPQFRQLLDYIIEMNSDTAEEAPEAAAPAAPAAP